LGLLVYLLRRPQRLLLRKQRLRRKVLKPLIYLTQADRAIAEAVRAQRQAESETLVSAQEVNAPKKPGLIPTSAEEARALGQKILDKLLSRVVCVREFSYFVMNQRMATS